MGDFAFDPNKLLISVIIPTRNRSSLLSKAIESVLKQKRDDIEVIVVDDASEDCTSETIDKYREKFKKFTYIRNDKRRGGAASRNIGIRKTSGRYISFLDDDDEWLPEKLDFQSRFLNSNPDVMAISSWYVEDMRGRKRNMKKYKKISFEDILWGNFFGSYSFVMIRREVFDKIGLLDENLVNAQDWDFWLRISKDHKVAIVNKLLAVYYRHSSEKISILTSDGISSYAKVYEKYKDFMSEACRRHHIKKLIFWESKLIAGRKKRLERFLFLLRKYRINCVTDIFFILYGCLSLYLRSYTVK